MQTFLPYADFALSAKCLDNRRLNKQILEAKSIHNVIVYDLSSWRNHPIVKMWRNYPEAIALYYNACLSEWKYIRGKNHKYELFTCSPRVVELPTWFGDERIHSSHRANLLRKDFKWYSQYCWDEINIDYMHTPYYWAEYGYGKIPKK